MNLLRSVSLLALLAAALSASAQVTVYTSLDDWQAAVGTAPTTLETFAGRPFNDFTNQTRSFNGFDLTSSTRGGGVARVNSGNLDLFVDADLPSEFTFAPSATSFGFGGLFTGANDGEGLRIQFSNGETVDLSVNTGFFGFTSVASFTSFTLVGRGNGDVGSGEFSFLDDVRFATSSAPSVPGPLAALPFALIALRRRKRA